MTKDKKYIENLLKRYRENKSEVELISVMGIDYSSVRVQTSNISNLDNMVIKIQKIKKEINIVDALIKSLKAKERFIIESFYKEGRTLMWIGNQEEVRIETENGVGMAKTEAIKKMTSVYNRNIKYFELLED